ncbi:MAG: dipeptide ABC transporter ATP-binding protein [Aggregatilineales bacterium]
MASISPLLAIDNLTVSYRIGNSQRDVVRGVSLHVDARQVYGLVGESGSGKSTLALSVMRYLPANGRVTAGQITLAGESLLDKSVRDMRSIWGAKMNLVPQDPGGSLNPAMRIGAQLTEIGQRAGLSARDAQQRSLEWLAKVRIADGARIAKLYPHQLSGGMQQRVMIAMALSSVPQLLVLDEPTTNLDVTTEAAMLDLFRELIHEQGSATLYVTHNLGVVAQLCDRVAVLYSGEIMEDASVADLFAHPIHPYTTTLLNAIPRLGQPPPHAEMPVNQKPTTNVCVFSARCPFAIDLCRTVKPPLEQIAPGHSIKCHRWKEIVAGTLQFPRNNTAESSRSLSGEAEPDAVPLVMAADHVRKEYVAGLSILARLQGHPAPTVKAVDDVTLTIQRGQTVGLVGESGSGKTTLARCVIGLVERNSGKIEVLNVELSPGIHGRPAEALRRVQMVFQNPEESLNPYLTIGETLRRPLITLLHQKRAEADEKVRAMLRAVRLPDSYIERLPGELSGGEKQRIAIARAFITDPDLVICDEAVSALDVSVQAAILDLLMMLKSEQGTSYLFISHDLAVVGSIADMVAVMYLGLLFEVVPRAQLLTLPLHPYTEALLAAIPVPDPKAPHAPIRLESDTPSPTHLPTGCRFHTRCPRKWGPICEQQEPPWVEVGGGHWLRCHMPLAELAATQAETLRTSLIQPPGA